MCRAYACILHALCTNVLSNKSPGLGQSQARARPAKGLWLGSQFGKAKAPLRPGQSQGFWAKPGLNNTSLSFLVLPSFFSVPPRSTKSHKKAPGNKGKKTGSKRKKTAPALASEAQPEATSEDELDDEADAVPRAPA